MNSNSNVMIVITQEGTKKIYRVMQVGDDGISVEIGIFYNKTQASKSYAKAVRMLIKRSAGGKK